MLIFGGMNYNGFLNNELYVIEFDDSAQKKKILEEKRESFALSVISILYELKAKAVSKKSGRKTL